MSHCKSTALLHWSPCIVTTLRALMASALQRGRSTIHVFVETQWHDSRMTLQEQSFRQTERSDWVCPRLLLKNVLCFAMMTEIFNPFPEATWSLCWLQWKLSFWTEVSRPFWLEGLWTGSVQSTSHPQVCQLTQRRNLLLLS